MAKNSAQFQTIRSEGALLPPDVLQLIISQKVDGTAPTAYHLPPDTKVNEAIAHSWSVLQKYWKGFQEIRGRLPEGETGTEATNQNWLLPLFEELKYGRLVTTKSLEIDGRTYPIERFYSHVPIHLIGCNLPLDQRTKGARGAATASPHSMMQEFLNRREESLWGFFSNGLVLRILRDNVSLSRQAYVEFDLEAMMEGEVYADFALLWMLCHQSRVEGDKPQEFWLEKWSQLAREQGTRVLSDLRDGVAKAIEALGRGFLAHPRNDWLRQQLQDGQLDKQEYYRQVLRTVYRLLFLFVAEDRGLLHGPDADSAACELYDTHYSTRRLRELADQIRGSKHSDMWHSLSLVFDALGRSEGCPQLGLPALGSFLWRRSSASALLGPAGTGAEAVEHPACITNDDLLSAIRALAFVEQDKARRSVDYRNLGSEELGSVYESLLELHPVVNIPGRIFELNIAAGHERKTTGSYYTPDSLVQCLLDSALEPVVADRIEGKKADEAAKAITDLKVCDPACGSGHFLIAAAHRLARHLARMRSGETEPSPVDYQHALRDVISHCIYGVDINPMAVELCKVSLWMEAMEPGKPLSFLDHHIQCGNSLLGATPALLKQGIPDEAFEPIEGDDKKLCKEYKKQNRDERRGQKTLFAEAGKPWERMGDLAVALATFDATDDDSLDSIRNKEERYAELVGSADYLSGRFWADAWCAAFVWKKSKDFDYAITEDVFRRIERNPHDCTPWMREEIQRLAHQYQFLHWHLAFPQVFRVPGTDTVAENEQNGWSGGFDVVLGNPPWERVTFAEAEWFALRNATIAKARNASVRREMISALRAEDPALYANYCQARRETEGIGHFLRNSARFPLSAHGDINTYAAFAEINRHIIAPTGRVGCIVPLGIATDNATSYFFRDLMANGCLVSLHSFENESLIFPDVHHATKFSLVTIAGRGKPDSSTDFIFFARCVDDLRDRDRHFALSARDMRTMNPNMETCMIFRSGRDADLNKSIYGRIPVFYNRSSGLSTWNVSLSRMFHMGDDSDLFRVPEELEADGWRLDGNVYQREHSKCLPLYEAKMVYLFDHRFGTYKGQTDAQANQGKLPELGTEDHCDPMLNVLPRYWVAEEEVNSYFDDKKWDRQWVLGWRNITSAVTSRTMITTPIPLCAVGDPYPLVFVPDEYVAALPCLQGNLSSLVFDYCTRQKIGGTHLTYTLLEQLPVLPPHIYGGQPLFPQADSLTTWLSWIRKRVLELDYTSWDIQPFANDCGYSGPPFVWDEDRRFFIRCELDAAYFHLYGIVRSDVEYIMDTFPLVREEDEHQYRDYRTKRLILEIYDELSRAIQTGKPYQTHLDPLPGPPCDANGNFIPAAQWDRAHWPVHIHLSKEPVLAAPDDVSVAEFAAMAYPADADKAICAAALAVVEQSGGLSSMEHLDSLLLATHPDWCKAFLDKRNLGAFDAACKLAPAALFVGQGRSIRWKECRDYLEQLDAVTVAHGIQNQPIGAGTALSSVQANLATGVDGVVKYVLMALARIRELRKTPATMPQAQRLILDAFEEQYRLCGLAA